MVGGVRKYKRIPKPKLKSSGEKMTTREVEIWLEGERSKFFASITGEYETPLLFGEVMDMWWEVADIRDTTRQTYNSQIPKIKKVFGTKRIDKVTEYDVRKYIKTLSQGITENNLAIISNVCKMGMSQGFITVNPTANIKLEKSHNKKKIYTHEEIALLLASLEAHDNAQLRLFVTLAVNSGMRTAEMLGLSWDSVNLFASTIHIHQQLIKTKAKGLHIFPKTKNGKERTIKIPTDVMKMLSDWHKQSDNDMVFFDDRDGHNGSFLSTTRPRDWLASHCRKIGLEYCSPHSFRHYYATSLINDRINPVAPATVAEILGDKVSTVIDRYVQAETGAIDVASEAINDLLNRAKNPTFEGDLRVVKQKTA